MVAKDEAGGGTQLLHSPAPTPERRKPPLGTHMETTCFFLAHPLLMLGAGRITFSDLRQIFRMAMASFSLIPPSESLIKCMLDF